MSKSDWRCERHPIEIGPADIDHMGHVNNAVYLRWVQEAVIAHWRRVAPPQDFARHLWVALKHEITYRRAAFLHDSLVAVATLDAVKGARALYRVQVRRGDECVAEAVSHWCSVDEATGRPLRLARGLVARFDLECAAA